VNRWTFRISTQVEALSKQFNFNFIEAEELAGSRAQRVLHLVAHQMVTQTRQLLRHSLDSFVQFVEAADGQSYLTDPAAVDAVRQAPEMVRAQLVIFAVVH
jgi:hypothetical protein